MALGAVPLQIRRQSSWQVWPLLVITSVALGWQARTPGITYWPQASAHIAFYAQFLVAIAGFAVAAQQAMIARRQPIVDLEATFLPSPATRLLGRWFAATIWPVATYTVSAALLLALSWPHATWGRPDLTVLALGGAVCIAGVSTGTLVGHLAPWRLLIPGWLLLYWILDAVVSAGDTRFVWATSRAFLEVTDRSIFRETAPAHIDARQLAWFLAFSATAVTLSAALVDPRRRTAVALTLTTASLLASGSVLVQATPRLVYGSGAARPFAPVCQREAGFAVCLHPAEAPLLDATVAILEPLLAALPDVATMPDRFVDLAVATHNPDAVGLYVANARDLPTTVTMSFIEGLFPTVTDPVAPSLTRAQASIATWLWVRSGLPAEEAPYWAYVVPTAAEAREPYALAIAISDEAARLGRIDPANRRAWLGMHWDGIRSGTEPTLTFPP